jgi:leucyl-tRNA synthetase
VDYRCSGNDLISNHLTFFLYHHAELFEEPKWPQGITVMGMGLLEGEKMSSSKGHVVLPSDAIEEYGADTVRFFLLNSAEPWQDYDWRSEQVQSTHDQLARFWTRAQDVIETASDGGESDLNHIDHWLLSKLQGTVRDVTEAMENFETRSASQAAFYRFDEHLKWYRKRADLDRPGAKWTLQEVLQTRLRLLAPFVPFMANELHEQLTGDSIDEAVWPEPASEFEYDQVEFEETLVEDLSEAVRDIVDVTETDPDTIRVYVAAGWKRTVLEEVIETGSDVGAVMGKVMQYEELREKGNEVNDLAQVLVEFVRARPDDEVEIMADVSDRERSVYENAQRFFEREFDAEVEIYTEGEDADDPADKAGNAVPFRPAIHLE